MRNLIVLGFMVMMGVALVACVSQPPAQISPLSYSSIAEAMGAKVSSNWVSPVLNPQQGVTVAVKLSENGDLTSLSIVKSSGDAGFDNSLLRAIRKSIPLPIPADELSKYREFEMTFER